MTNFTTNTRKTLEITTEETEYGTYYNFIKNKIHYTVKIEDDKSITVIRNSQIRSGGMSIDCYWNGINNQGKPMAKFLKNVVSLITT